MRLAVIAVLLSACAPAPAADRPAQAIAAEPTAPAALGATRARVTTGACTSEGCPISVALPGVAPVMLAWPAPSATQAAAPADATLGAGEPLAPFAGPAWTIGGEEQGVTVGVQPVRTADGREALLVHQAAGFDHVKRRHDLFVVEDGALRLAWSEVEGEGPYYTAVAPAPGALTVFRGFHEPDADAPERLSVTRVTLRPGTAIEQSVEGPLPAVLLGGYATAGAARTARGEAPGCLDAFWVLPASRAGGGGGFVLAAPATTAAAAQQGLQTVRACAPSAGARVGEIVNQPSGEG